MSKSLETLNIPAPAGPIRAAFATPPGPGPHPAVVVLQEAFGFTQQILGVARRLLEEGYAVVVPDLYSRDPLRRELTDEDVALGFPISRAADREAALSELLPEERPVARKVIAWLDQRDSSQYLPDSLAAIEWARQEPGLARNRIAVLGFCMGGGLVGQIAAHGAPVQAGILFYGQIPPTESIPRIRIPLLGQFAEHDPSITPKVPDFARTLSLLGIPFSWSIHPGTRHGFFNETRDAYHIQASESAWNHLLDFLDTHLHPHLQLEPQTQGTATR